MSKVRKASSPRERILATALDLFYRQGYLATGINQIISEAKVARASFYDHFASKEDLFYEYAKATAQRETRETIEAINRFASPKDRFFGLLTLLPDWLERCDYRGCPFQIMLAESPPNDERIHAVVREHHQDYLELIKNLTEDLITSNSKYKSLNVEEIARNYLVLVDGAIAAAVAYRETWPIDQARETLKKLLKSNKN